MRFDKLTTKFQQALADAQSIANVNDNAYIEPQHLLLALLNDADSGSAALLARAGVNVQPLRAALDGALARIAKISGADSDITVGKELARLLNATDKAAMQRGDQFISSDLFLLALCDDKGETGRLLKEHGGNKTAIQAAVDAVRGGNNVDNPEADGQREALNKYCI